MSVNSQWAVFLRKIPVSRLFCYLLQLWYLLVLVISKIPAEFAILERAVRTGTPLLLLMVQNAAYQHLTSENSTSPTCSWSFCRFHLHHLHIGSLPLTCTDCLVTISCPILMPSSYTLHQPGEQGSWVNKWFSGTRVTFSTYFSSYSKARTAQSKKIKIKNRHT